LLVSGAALLVQTLRNLQRTTLGFDPRDRFAITVETRRTAYDTQGMTAQRTDEMLRRVRAIPGVLDAAFASLVPVYGGRGVSDLVTVRGTTPLAAGAQTDFTGVSPGYFTALGIPLLAGRDIGPMTGVLGPTRDVVVNEQFAKTFFPDRNPIGQTFNDGDEGDTVSTQDRVVGVVGNTKTTELRSPAAPMFYVPIADGDWPYLVLVVRSAAGVAGASSAITRAIAAVAPGINQGDPTPIASSIETALARERMSAALATLFGAIALCLVAVGLYGVILYQVAERTTEIGIRMALGAGSRKVIALVLRQSLSVVAAGLIVGLPLSLLAGRAVASQLYGVTPYSMWALATAATSLVAIAAAATLIPARRAARIDPLTALRAD
jgi:putative ABC transport system permease protein